jgi:hypothetical protein
MCLLPALFGLNCEISVVFRSFPRNFCCSCMLESAKSHFGGCTFYIALVVLAFSNVCSKLAEEPCSVSESCEVTF